MKFKKDKYRNSRGGYSRVLRLYCRVCENTVAYYQKDGPGNLRRVYLDRIIAPKKFAILSSKTIKEVPLLKCSKCKEDLGTPYIYKK